MLCTSIPPFSVHLSVLCQLCQLLPASLWCLGADQGQKERTHYTLEFCQLFWIQDSNLLQGRFQFLFSKVPWSVETIKRELKVLIFCLLLNVFFYLLFISLFIWLTYFIASKQESLFSYFCIHLYSCWSLHLMEFIHHSSHLFISLISSTPPSLQVWFQNRRMKDKRQRHTMPWPHPLVDPLGALLMGRASPSSTLPYPFIPPPLPHIPLHQYSSLALSLPATSAHSPYSAPMRPLDALRLFQYHSRPGGLPQAAALYPSASTVHHPSSCPCPLCLHSRPELLKTRGEALGLSQPRSLKATIQPADVEWTEEIV